MNALNQKRRFRRSPPRAGSRTSSCRDLSTVSTEAASSLGGLKRADSVPAQSVAEAGDRDEMPARSRGVPFDTRDRGTLAHRSSGTANPNAIADRKFGGLRQYKDLQRRERAQCRPAPPSCELQPGNAGRLMSRL